MDENERDWWTFVHYSDIPKLGIRPDMNNMGETPTGIYGWPVAVDTPGESLFSSSTYKFTFRVKESARGKIWTFGPGPSEFELTPEELQDRLIKVVGGMFTKADNSLMYLDKKRYDSYADLYDAFKGEMMRWGRAGGMMTKALRRAGISGAVDWGIGLLFDDTEPAQGFFFKIGDLEIVSMEDQHRKQRGSISKGVHIASKFFRDHGISSKLSFSQSSDAWATFKLDIGSAIELRVKQEMEPEDDDKFEAQFLLKGFIHLSSARGPDLYTAIENALKDIDGGISRHRFKISDGDMEILNKLRP